MRSPPPGCSPRTATRLRFRHEIARLAVAQAIPAHRRAPHPRQHPGRAASGSAATTTPGWRSTPRRGRRPRGAPVRARRRAAGRRARLAPGGRRAVPSGPSASPTARIRHGAPRCMTRSPTRLALHRPVAGSRGRQLARARAMACRPGDRLRQGATMSRLCTCCGAFAAAMTRVPRPKPRCDPAHRSARPPSWPAAYASLAGHADDERQVRRVHPAGPAGAGAWPAARPCPASAQRRVQHPGLCPGGHRAATGTGPLGQALAIARCREPAGAGRAGPS